MRNSYAQVNAQFPVGTLVNVNQGFGRVTTGVVQGTCANTLCPGQTALQIEITGGVNSMGKPANVGAVCRVNPSHCTIA